MGQLDNYVAVVSSASSLLNHTDGTFIDKFPHIMRFNRAPTKGFEKHVGSRTTIRIIGGNILLGKPHQQGKWYQDPNGILREEPGVAIMYRTPEALKGIDSDTIQRKIHHNSQAYEIPRKLESVLEKVYGFPSKHDKRLSSGSLGIALCIYLGYTPVVFGFSPKKSQDRSHYWEKRDPNAAPIHNHDLEVDLLQEQVSKGLVLRPRDIKKYLHL